MATTFCVDVQRQDKTWETIALFSDEALASSMIEFAKTQFECAETPYLNITIEHLKTGDVVWEYFEGFEFDEPADLEMGFNPYEGCYDFDC